MEENNLAELNNKLGNIRVSKRFEDILGKHSASFMASITSAVQDNERLKKADTNSIILASIQAAEIELPIVKSLGLAAIVPFYDSNSGKTLAQFQVMRNGWIELAVRTGLFEFVVNEPVHEGEIVKMNKFIEQYEFDQSKRTSNKVVGYMAFAQLLSGYHKTVYWTSEECLAHAKRYSQTFKKGYGLWKSDFDAMALKTVLKNLITKFTPKSVDYIKNAILSDQAVFSGDIDAPVMKYLDNDKSNVLSEENKPQNIENFDEAEDLSKKEPEKVQVKTTVTSTSTEPKRASNPGVGTATQTTAPAGTQTTLV